MLSLYLVPTETSLERGASLLIEGDEAHHLARVARHRVGERIWISDGAGRRATVLIEEVSGDQVQARVEELVISQSPRVRLRVVQGLPKSDRAHECVELLVAAGVDEIVPWRAERSIGKWEPGTSERKWEQWIRAAVKQTRRDRIPNLLPYCSGLNQSRDIFTSESEKELVFALHEDASEVLDSNFATQFREQVAQLQRITLIIGPEGGLAAEELDEISRLSNGNLRLGTPIFRSAHAGAIALTSLQASFALWR